MKLKIPESARTTLESLRVAEARRERQKDSLTIIEGSPSPSRTDPFSMIAEALRQYDPDGSKAHEAFNSSKKPEEKAP